MIVLDTDVISALLRPGLNPIVVAWLDGQDPTQVRITAVSLHEIMFGIHRLPDGRRRQSLAANLAALLTSDIGSSVLLLNHDASRRSAIAQVNAERATGHYDVADCLIAGIAAANSASVATRNQRHFQHLGVPLINPWSTLP